MSKHKSLVFWIFLGLIFLAPQMPALAGEHPGAKVGGAEEKMVKQAAQSHIDEQVKKNGSFEITDPKLNKKRKSKFDYFHTINQLDNGDYFFCADFTEGKDRLDIDFTLSGDDLSVKEAVIHKVNGTAR